MRVGLRGTCTPVGCTLNGEFTGYLCAVQPPGPDKVWLDHFYSNAGKYRSPIPPDSFTYRQESLVFEFSVPTASLEVMELMLKALVEKANLLDTRA